MRLSRHGLSHNPFEQFDSEENKKRYEAEQQQRALERAIRKSKRKCEGLKTAVDNADEATRPVMQEAYGKAAAKLRAQNAEYKQFCEDNGLKTRQDRVSIAGWDRKQAAQARAAEKNRNPDAPTLMFHRRTGSKGQELIDAPTYNKITAPFIKKGAIILKADEAMQKHLDENDASAATFGDVIFFGAEITLTDVLEETHHVEQFWKGLNKELSDKCREIANEIDAKQYLISAGKKYKMCDAEMELAIKQLKSYTDQMERLKEAGEWH